MAKKRQPLTRQQMLEAVANECRERGMFFPSLEYTNPIRPSHQYGSQCHTKMHRILHLAADRLLRECGFFDERRKMLEWLECPYNRAWFEAANPNAITQDGHLASSSAFC